MASIFELPDDLLASLVASFPCRDAQINALATLVHPRMAACRNVVVHGTEATGKSAIINELLQTLRNDSPSDLNYAIVKSAECVTARHLFERTVGLVGDALQNDSTPGRCETLAALTAELTKKLKYAERDARSRFVLVFDSIDRQRDAPPTLLPALARLSEIIPNLTTVFVPPSTTPSTRPAGRTLPRLTQSCGALWPRFTAPVAAGTHKAREFSKLLIAARAYFQDESVLQPGIQRARNEGAINNSTALPAKNVAEKKSSSTTDLSALLPPTARYLLIAAYLASHNAPRHDNALLSTWHTGARKRRRGGATGSSTPNGAGRRAKHRRIARRLLGPGVFVLERMVAIYVATKQEWASGVDDAKEVVNGVDGDVGMAIATLASLRLLVRVGGGAAGAAVGAGGGADLDRGGKWRVNVGWEIIRGVGRSMGVEVEEWLVE
ncbi:hypothetical protein EKO27_g1460 [Xylaria grammica]|uniref:Uncharacterized protein n=1 Tax=Xylaria grammica TaxID=363999 RepID=A0A439DGZ2_9PEZI|nr:hypothetical protein EKO27_g1460 [Xylaria grammica]